MVLSAKLSRKGGWKNFKSLLRGIEGGIGPLSVRDIECVVYPKLEHHTFAHGVDLQTNTLNTNIIPGLHSLFTRVCLIRIARLKFVKFKNLLRILMSLKNCNQFFSSVRVFQFFVFYLIKLSYEKQKY